MNFLKCLLRQIYQPVLHTHTCQTCGLVWEHLQGGEYEHTCPGCGREETRKSWAADWAEEGDETPIPEVTVSMLPLR